MRVILRAHESLDTIMTCPTGHIARGSIVLQSGNRFVRLLRSCGLSRGVNCKAFSSGQLSQLPTFCAPAAQQNAFCQRRRPTQWGCRLHTSCQASAGSPHTATVEATEKKQSRQQGHLVALPTTDESASLDRIRHSVSVFTLFHTQTHKHLQLAVLDQPEQHFVVLMQSLTCMLLLLSKRKFCKQSSQSQEALCSEV